MTSLSLPALYKVADAASNAQQSRYFTLVKVEYAALIIASMMSVNVIADSWYITLYGVALALALGMLVLRSVTKPERKWYQARALAESVKTTTWKYAMGSRPFKHDAGDGERLRTILRDLLQANRELGDQFDGKIAAGDQVTSDMNTLRAMTPEHRLAAYVTDRIDSQLNWYADKSRIHKRWGVGAAWALGFLYVLAFIIFLLRVSHPEWSYAHPDPVILLAASVLGWMQIKRFNELSASYSLTATEIGILKSRAAEVSGERALSIFIDDAEEAFSREHTQWLARRSVSI